MSSTDALDALRERLDDDEARFIRERIQQRAQEAAAFAVEFGVPVEEKYALWAAFHTPNQSLFLAEPGLDEHVPPSGEIGTPTPQPLEAARGQITEWTYNHLDHRDGFVLDSDAVVHFPPHRARQIASQVEIGDDVNVVGVLRTTTQGDPYIDAYEIESSIGRFSIDLASSRLSVAGMISWEEEWLEPLLGREFWQRLDERVSEKPLPERLQDDTHSYNGNGHSECDHLADALNQDGNILAGAAQLTVIGERSLREHDYRRAEVHLEEARSILDAFIEIPGQGAIEHWEQLAKVQRALVSAAYSRGDLKQALQRATEWLDWAHGMRLRATEVRFLLWKAELLALGGQIVPARTSLADARKALRTRTWSAGEPKPLMQAILLRIDGMIKVRSGEWHKAERSFNESLNVARDDESINQTELLEHKAYIERDLCYLRIRQGRLEEAIEHCECSYEWRRQLGQGLRALAIYYAQVADIYRAGRDAGQDMAEERLRDALYAAMEGFEDIGDDLDLARVHLRLARLHRKESRPREAQYWARCALRFGQRAQLPLYVALAQRQYGLALDLESEQGQFNDDARYSLQQQAIHHLEQSLKSMASLHDPFEIATSQRALATVLTRRSTPQAPHDLSRARELLEAAQSTFERLGAELEFEKTWRAIHLLERSFPQLEAALETK